MDWAFIYLMVVLKLPVAALLWLVWWSVRAVPEPAAGSEDDRGPRRDDRPRPRAPLGPRRGPHAGERPPRSPERVRIARGRRLRPTLR
jgi:hypothetical protein